MRIAATLTAVLLCVTAAAQTIPAGTPVEVALDRIADRYDVDLAYAAAVVNGLATEDAHRLATLNSDLAAVLTPVGLRYGRVGRQYVITVAPVRDVSPAGFVEDGDTGERLVGATVYAVSARRGTASNAYGYFALTDLPPGERLVFRYLGYASDTISARELAPGPATVRLRPDLQLLTVEVTERVATTRPLPIDGASLSPELLERTRLLNGQRDINSYLAHRAGIVSAANGYRGYGFRGADPEHNLTLLDDATLYLPSHAVGYFSIVPGAALRSWRLYRDAGPARYGDRVGGVLDLRLREGNRLERGGSIDLGLSDITGTAEGPLGNGSYFVSGRRALSDFWLDLFRPESRLREESRPEISFGFYDVAAKINQRLSERQQVYASVFVGRDRYRDAARAFESDAEELTVATDRSKRVWQNAIGSVRHSAVLGDRSFANSTLTVSDFRYRAADDSELRVARIDAPDSAAVAVDTTLYDSRISDLGFKSDLQYAVSPDFVATVGVDATLHRFAVSNFSQATPEDIPGTLQNLPVVFALDLSTYVSLDYRPSGRLQATGGLRLSSQLSKWAPQLAPLPRFRIEYQAIPALRVFGAVGQARQYIHRISTNNPGLPRELWVPTIRGLRPLVSSQWSGGVVLTPTKVSTVSLTGYRTRLLGLTRLSNDFLGANYDDWIENLREGNGTSSGLEVEFAYELEEWSWEGAYTYARAMRRFEDAFGRLQAVERARLDRRHAFSLLGEYRPSSAWTLSGGLRIGSGLPARRPQRSSPIGNLATDLPLTNGWNYDGEMLELRGFLSLDLAARWRGGPHQNRSLSFGAQNVTLRRNPLFYNLRAVPDPEPGQARFEFTEVFAPRILPFLRFEQSF